MLPAYGLYGHIRNNNLKSAALLAGFIALSLAFWFALCLLWTALTWSPPRRTYVAGLEDYLVLVAEHALNRATSGWYWAIGAACGWLGIAFVWEANLIRQATGARDISRRENPQLYNMVEQLAIAAGLPMPRVEVLETEALNAYAAGLSPDAATIVVTRGLLRTLSPDELQAVLAHEMAHIRNYDVRLLVVAIVMAGGLTFLGSLAGKAFSGGINTFDLANIGWRLSRGSGRSSDPRTGAAKLVVVCLAIALLATIHLFALLTRFGISRSREFLADAGAVELTKNPDALISALLKISGADELPQMPASMRAMLISNPLQGWLATHPSIEARVAALQQMAGGRLPETQATPRRSRWGKDRATSATQATAPDADAGPWGTSPPPATSAQSALGLALDMPPTGFGRRRLRRRPA